MDLNSRSDPAMTRYIDIEKAVSFFLIVFGLFYGLSLAKMFGLSSTIGLLYCCPGAIAILLCISWYLFRLHILCAKGGAWFMLVVVVVGVGASFVPIVNWAVAVLLCAVIYDPRGIDHALTI